MVDNMRPASIEDTDEGNQYRAGVGESAEYGGSGDHNPSKQPKKGFPAGLGVGIFVILVLGTVGFAVVPLIVGSFKQDYLMENGTRAPAKILAVAETNTQHNHRWVYELSLEVYPEGRAPYRTQVSQAFSELHAVNLRPGGAAEIRYDARDPKAVVVMSTGGALPASVTAPTDARGTAPTSPAATVVPACQMASACCLLVAGDAESETNCAGLLNPIMPPASCTAVLDGYKLAAKHKGITCPDAPND